MSGSIENLVRPDPAEGEEMEALRREIDSIFKSGRQTGRLVGPDGESVEIPASALRALRAVVDGLARGLAMTLIPHGRELTTGQAAEILKMSRQHLVRVIDAGEIPSHRVGNHRRVRIDDVLAYRERRARNRHRELEALIAASEEAPGGYR